MPANKATASSPRLELIDISKRFPGTLANDQISFQVMPGEIHALLGENGAGKSTLMNIIYGVLKPDKGTMLWNNREVEIKDPQAAKKLGIGMVFQHFSLLETLSVRENLLLALPELNQPQSPSVDERLDELAGKHDLKIDPDALVASLSAGQKQRVEIARCLLQNVKLLILDEPTSVLTPAEAEDLLVILKKLAAQDCSILFISHKLAEIKSVCDKATVLRDGKRVASCIPQDKTTEEITEMMLGPGIEIEQTFAQALSQELSQELTEKCCLKIDNLSTVKQPEARSVLANLSFELRSGEILGLAGVAGNGQDQMLDMISGELQVKEGHIYFEGDEITGLSVRKRRQLGISALPVERLTRCVAPALSLRENFLLTRYLDSEFINHSLVDWPNVAHMAEQVIAKYRVKASSSDDSASSLSGGNLQKFLMGREIEKQPRLLVCYNPTWGVDVGAANLVHKSLIALREQGAAILVISEDLDELFTISDRLGALCAGRLSPILAKTEVDLTLLGQWMTGDFSEVDSTEALA